MVRLSKLTDYALVVLSCMARTPNCSRAARDLALELRLPLPTVSKVLKELLQSELLLSHRGIKGGYRLARDPHEISVAEVIAALEGPVALTECSTDTSGLCALEPCCAIKKNQQIISQAVRGVLDRLTLSDLIRPLQLSAVKDAHGRLITTIGVTSGRTQ
ncbi:MAG: SUF system Fe-S cluster assembly regulator [Acidobacteriaceae bacterium]